MLRFLSHLVTFSLYFPRRLTQNFVLGFQFAFVFVIAYASSRTLGTAYGYSPIKIGFVTLSLGVGKFFLFKYFQIDLLPFITLGEFQEASLVVCGVAAGLIMSFRA